MKAVGIVGFKKSGKTTLALELGAELKRRGVVAAAAKFSSHSLDRDETDTSRLREVYGSCAGLTEQEAAVFYEGKRFLPDLMPMLLGEVLVVEGGKSLGWLPRIILPKTEDEVALLKPELALGSWGEIEVPGLQHFTDIGELADCVLEKGFALPGLDCGACGNPGCEELAREIVAGRATVADCKSSKGDKLSLKVGGKRVAMNGFVGDMIAASVEGMVDQLKGVGPGEIRLTIKR